MRSYEGENEHERRTRVRRDARVEDLKVGLVRVGETGVWALGTIESVLGSHRARLSRWNSPVSNSGP